MWFWLLVALLVASMLAASSNTNNRTLKALARFEKPLRTSVGVLWLLFGLFNIFVSHDLVSGVINLGLGALCLGVFKRRQQIH